MENNNNLPLKKQGKKSLSQKLLLILGYLLGFQLGLVLYSMAIDHFNLDIPDIDKIYNLITANVFNEYVKSIYPWIVRIFKNVIVYLFCLICSPLIMRKIFLSSKTTLLQFTLVAILSTGYIILVNYWLGPIAIWFDSLIIGLLVYLNFKSSKDCESSLPCDSLKTFFWKNVLFSGICLTIQLVGLLLFMLFINYPGTSTPLLVTMDFANSGDTKWWDLAVFYEYFVMPFFFVKGICFFVEKLCFESELTPPQDILVHTFSFLVLWFALTRLGVIHFWCLTILLAFCLYFMYLEKIEKFIN